MITVYNVGWYELLWELEEFTRQYLNHPEHDRTKFSKGSILLGQTKTFDNGTLWLKVIAARPNLNTYEHQLWMGGTSENKTIIAHGTTFNPWVEVRDG